MENWAKIDEISSGNPNTNNIYNYKEKSNNNKWVRNPKRYTKLFAICLVDCWKQIFLTKHSHTFTCTLIHAEM